jgi:hypothetical protein
MGFALLDFSSAFQAIEHLCCGWYGACEDRGASEDFYRIFNSDKTFEILDSGTFELLLLKRS